MTDLFEDSPNDQKKADGLINAGHLDIVNRSPLSLVFNEDCVAGMKRFSDGHFDLAIVDPPYGIGFSDYERGSSGLQVKERYTKSGKKKWDDEIPSPEYFKELFRVSKNQIIWGGNYFALPATQCFIFWYKHNPVPNFADGEFARTSFKQPAKCFDCMCYGNINQDPNKIHPTQKPIYLYEWVLANFAKSGYKILDTHLGSGSSRIACEKAGLDFVGFDNDEEIFNLQEKRFKDHLVQGRLFGADFC